MISIFALKSAGGAEHYYSKDNYYTQDEGVENSQWFGEGAKDLGLSGQVKPEDFKALLNGQVDDRQLGKRERNEQGDLVTQHRAGYDITFSAPKSVSIMSEIYSDTELREAHENAVRSTLSYLEENTIQVRQQIDGEMKSVNTGKVVAALFSHDTSRELDPQTHTHAVVLNMSVGEDGKWRSLDSSEVFDQKRVIAAIYNAELAKEVQSLGYEISVKDDKGNFEIVGIDRDQIDSFSQRRQQIEESLRDRGIDINSASFEVREEAALKTRDRKTEIDSEELKKEWLERADTIKLDGIGIRESANSVRQDRSDLGRNLQPMTGKEAVTFAIQHLTEREAVFEKKDIQTTALVHAVGRVRADEVIAAFKQLEKEGELIKLEDGRYTSKSMLDSEHLTVSQMLTEKGSMVPVMMPNAAKEQIKAAEDEQKFDYSKGQKEAILKTLTSTDRYVAVQGLAGTGKTTMLRGLKDIAQDQGMTVRGMAITGSASDTLARETGIQSETLQMFMIKEARARSEIAQAQAQNPDQKIDRKPELWVVDESSLVGQRQMDRLVNMAQEANAKVVFLGDKLQLQSVSAGKPFEVAQDRGIETAKMTEINRQKTQDLKEVVSNIVDSNHSDLSRNREAFKLLDEKGGVVSSEDSKEALVKNYLSLDTEKRNNTIIITPFNKDRLAINAEIREGLKEQGAISQQGETHRILTHRSISKAEQNDIRYFKEGDVIRFGRDYRALGISKGDYWTLKETDQTTGKGILQNQKGETKEWLPSKTTRIEVYQASRREIAQGDQIRFTRNESTFKNGERGEVVDLKDGIATIAVSKGDATEVHQVSLVENGHWDHAYAQTIYSSQGMTKQNTLLYINIPEQKDEKGQRKQVEQMGKIFGDRAFYVAVTRASHDFKLYTNDKAQTQELVGIQQDKTTSLEQSKGYERQIER